MIAGTVVLTGGTASTELLGPVDADYDVTVAVLTSGCPVAFAAASFTIPESGNVETAGGWYVVADTASHAFRVQNGESLYVAEGESDNCVVTFAGNPVT